MGAESGQKKVKKDIRTRNEALQAKERSYKNVARSKAADKKEDAARQALMNNLAKKEKETSSKDVGAKEKTVKGAAASIQEAKTEAETKSTQKSERSAKAMLSLSKEKLSKNMKKESVAHADHQRAGGKVQLHKCVVACAEGRKKQL